MLFAVVADENIPDLADFFFTVVVVNDLTLRDNKDFFFALVHMLPDAAAGFKGDIRKQSALAVKLFLADIIGDFYRAVAAAHLLTQRNGTFFFSSDHKTTSDVPYLIKV